MSSSVPQEHHVPQELVFAQQAAKVSAVMFAKLCKPTQATAELVVRQ
jgi:hypothetical protein